jgi:hypothetical protein
MLKKILVAAFIAVLVAGCATKGTGPAVVRIDASTSETAEASYKAMIDRLPQAKQMQLSLAVLTINMIGVNSAKEVVGNPELQSPTIGRIKDRVGGMSAEEIIAYAAKNSTVQIMAPGQ